MKPERKCLTSQEIELRLKAANIQPTAQRLAICKFVLCEADHPTAEDVKVWADKNLPKISLATVYNTLNSMVEAGLLREVRFPHQESSIFDCNVSDHFHFLDEETGTIIDLDPSEVEVKIKPGSQFQVRSTDLLIRGRKRQA